MLLVLSCSASKLCHYDQATCFQLVSEYEPLHDKTNKMTMRPAKTQISLGIRLSSKETSVPYEDNEDSDQTGRMPRLIWVFTGRTATLLVLSWGGSNNTRVPIINEWAYFKTIAWAVQKKIWQITHDVIFRHTSLSSVPHTPMFQ